MKRLALSLASGLVSGLALSSPNANAAQANGVVVFAISGTFKTPVSSQATALCTGLLELLPNVSGSTTLGSLPLGNLLQTGEQNAVASATINSPTSFSCTVTVHYRWDNFTAGQQMSIIYTVIAHDPGGTRPGKSRQILETIPVPANGTTTTVTVNVGL